MRARGGFTLLEMTIVLTILAVTTTMAIVLMEGTVDQARFDATQRQLQSVQDAILGPQGQDASSFVGDVGRLPALIVDADDPGNAVPKELWNRGLLREYGPIDSGDADVRLFTGWRGPYLQFSAGQPHLRDGWGRPFLMLKANEALSVPGVDVVERLRADNADRPVPFNARLEMPSVIGTNTWRGNINGMVYATSATPPTGMTLRLYSANGDLPTGFTAHDQALTFTASNVPGSTNSYMASYALSNIPAGPIALRVYENLATPGTGNRSAVVYAKMPPRGTVVRDLSMAIP